MRTDEINKIALWANDDKHVILNYGVNTVAYAKSEPR